VKSFDHISTFQAITKRTLIFPGTVNLSGPNLSLAILSALEATFLQDRDFEELALAPTFKGED
jgi:hypothetical protein